MFVEYKETTDLIVSSFGKSVVVEALTRFPGACNVNPDSRRRSSASAAHPTNTPPLNPGNGPNVRNAGGVPSAGMAAPR